MQSLSLVFLLVRLRVRLTLFVHRPSFHRERKRKFLSGASILSENLRLNINKEESGAPCIMYQTRKSYVLSVFLEVLSAKISIALEVERIEKWTTMYLVSPLHFLLFFLSLRKRRV